VFTPSLVIIALKVAVTLVTVLLVAAVTAIATGRKKLHGRINTVVFILTMATLIGFEVIIRGIKPSLTASFTEEQRQSLYVHLYFAIPSAILMPIMFWSGATHRRRIHIPLAAVFTIVWLGTFITGLMLPHDLP